MIALLEAKPPEGYKKEAKAQVDTGRKRSVYKAANARCRNQAGKGASLKLLQPLHRCRWLEIIWATRRSPCHRELPFQLGVGRPEALQMDQR